ncbi:MAG: aminomethyl-transferring glycine dehydrogenase subunit GcvPA, partial [Armatimonadetes bacterium]|nr:aminomethyl-transferring glycine dehydrogenase subunit GcvPA [Armatimonadota bacterium]
TLQAMFEYQTMICELTGMDVANASVYDGASACSEACLLAAQATRRQKILIADTLHPDTEAVLATTARFSGLDLVRIGHEPGRGSVSMADLQNELDNQTAALLVQYPNFFGILDDLPALAEAVHAHHALLVVSTDPIALGLLQPPGEAGADLVVGDGQALGLPLSFGGPSLGFFAARKTLMRRIPGRVVGQTRDARGARRYVVTLQTREQHIRREKATSNICTNQGLNALAATIYLALMGPHGLAQAAEQSTRQAHALYQRLLEIPGFSPVFDGPFFKEFTVRFAGDLTDLNQALDRDGFIGGLALESVRTDLAGLWLVAVTEKRTDADLDGLIASIQAFVAQGGLGS